MPLKFRSLHCFRAAIIFLTSSHLTLGLTVLSLSGTLFWYQRRFIEQILELLWNFNVFLLLYLEAPGFLFNLFLNISSECLKRRHIFHKSSVCWWRQDIWKSWQNLTVCLIFLIQIHCPKTWQCCFIFALLKLPLLAAMSDTQWQTQEPTYMEHLYKTDITWRVIVQVVSKWRDTISIRKSLNHYISWSCLFPIQTNLRIFGHCCGFKSSTLRPKKRTKQKPKPFSLFRKPIPTKAYSFSLHF